MNQVNIKSDVDNFVTTLRKTGKFFDIQDGSNYVVMTSFDRHYIIEFEQAMLIIKNLFGTEADFVTVNNTILNKKYIQCIEPTKELTKKQSEEAEKKAMEFRKLENRREELTKLKNAFDQEYFNKKYGVGKWKRYAFGINRGDELILTEKDFSDVNEAFKKQYPQEDKEIEKISENR